MRLPWTPVALAVLLLLVPAATAFPDARREVDVSYDDASRGPLALLTGEVALEGRVHEALLLGAADGTRLGPIPLLEVVSADAGGAAGAAVRDATLIVHEGGLLVRPGGAGLAVVAVAPYAVAIGLSEAPVGEDPGPGFLVGGEAFAGALASDAGEVDLVPLDAVVSVLRSDGAPVAGWDRRRVNEDAPSAGAGADAPGQALLRASGAFGGELRARVLAGALGSGGDLRLDARRADEPRFDEAVEAFALLGGAEGSPDLGGMRELAALAPVLNGGVLLAHVAPDEGGPAPRPTRATLDGEETDLGGFAVLRADAMRLAWSGGAMRVQGQAALAVTGQGVAVAGPAGAVFLFPALSLLLWAAAAVALVFFFLRRPPPGERPHLALRAGAVVAHAVVFVLAFLWWDAQFAETFGTSFLRMLSTGATFSDLPGAFFVLLLEMFPWGIAALAFALPARIALGVALRYLGKGKALRGFAKAGGLAALAVFGPLYALWWLNVVVLEAIDAFPGF